MRVSLSLASAVALAIAGTAPAHAGLLGGLLGGDGKSAGDGQPSAVVGDGGSFSEPFAEPTIQVDGEQVATNERCIANAGGDLQCKPAAGTIAVLGDGRFLSGEICNKLHSLSIQTIKGSG